MKKRILAVTIAALTLMATLIGCGSSNPAEETKKDESADRAKVATTFCEGMCNYDFASLDGLLVGKNTEALTKLDISSQFEDEASKKVFDLLKTKSSETTKNIKVVKEEKTDDKNFVLTMEMTYQDMSNFKDVLKEKTTALAEKLKTDESFKALDTEAKTDKVYELLYAELDAMKSQTFETKTVTTTVSVTNEDGWKISNANQKDWQTIITCGMNEKTVKEESSSVAN